MNHYQKRYFSSAKKHLILLGLEEMVAEMDALLDNLDLSVRSPETYKLKIEELSDQIIKAREGYSGPYTPEINDAIRQHLAFVARENQAKFIREKSAMLTSNRGILYSTTLLVLSTEPGFSVLESKGEDVPRPIDVPRRYFIEAREAETVELQVTSYANIIHSMCETYYKPLLKQLLMLFDSVLHKGIKITSKSTIGSLLNSCFSVWEGKMSAEASTRDKVIVMLSDFKMPEVVAIRNGVAHPDRKIFRFDPRKNKLVVNGAEYSSVDLERMVAELYDRCHIMGVALMLVRGELNTPEAFYKAIASR